MQGRDLEGGRERVAQREEVVLKRGKKGYMEGAGGSEVTGGKDPGTEW